MFAPERFRRVQVVIPAATASIPSSINAIDSPASSPIPRVVPATNSIGSATGVDSANQEEHQGLAWLTAGMSPRSAATVVASHSQQGNPSSSNEGHSNPANTTPIVGPTSPRVLAQPDKDSEIAIAIKERERSGNVLANHEIQKVKAEAGKRKQLVRDFIARQRQRLDDNEKRQLEGIEKVEREAIAYIETNKQKDLQSYTARLQ